MFTPNLTQYAQGAGKQESVRWGENGGPGKSAERGQVFSRRSRQKIWRGDCLITEGISVKSSSLWFFYIEVLFCNPLDYFCLLDFFHDFLHDQFLDVPITFTLYYPDFIFALLTRLRIQIWLKTAHQLIYFTRIDGADNLNGSNLSNL